MELSIKDWIELVGIIVLPILGFVLSLLMSGVKSEIRSLKEADAGLDGKLGKLQEDLLRWHTELPEKYARRDEMDKSFQQLRDLITRLDDKLERLLHRKLDSQE
jgi:chromosome segregation ATPase